MELPKLIYPHSNEIIACLRLVSIAHKLPPRHECYLLFGRAFEETDALARRMMLSTAIVRFCSAFLATEGDLTRVSLTVSAERKGVWAAVAKIRNQCAHGLLPALKLLDSAAHASMRWICAQPHAQADSDPENDAAQFYQVARRALLQHSGITEFLKQCDVKRDKMVISQIISRLVLQMPIEQVKLLQNASVSFLDDDPVVLIKRGLQSLYQKAQLPVLAFLTNEKCDMSKIHKITCLQFSGSVQQLLKVSAENDWESRAGPEKADIKDQQRQASDVRNFWLGLG